MTKALFIFRTVIAMVTVNHRVGLQYDVPEQLVFPMEILKQNNK
jgi:hypothetical protein